MNTLKHNFLNAGILMIFLALAATTFAQRGQGQRFDGKQQNECRIPDLTEEQQEQITTLRTNHRSEMDEYRADMRTLRAEYADLTSGSDYDIKAASEKADALTDVKNKMMKQNLEHRDEVRNLLTDEQIVYFDRHHFGRNNKGNGPGNFHKGRGYHKRGFGEGYGRSDRRCRWN